MIELIYDGAGHTGAIERRYVVGTRKLGDAVTVFLNAFVNSTPHPDRVWSRAIFRGIMSNSSNSPLPDISRWYKETDWLGDCIEWLPEEHGHAYFNVKERNIPVLLRRLISRPDGEVDLSKLKEWT